MRGITVNCDTREISPTENWVPKIETVTNILGHIFTRETSIYLNDNHKYAFTN